MTDFEWTNTIELGHAQIDEQHKRLLLLCTATIEPLANSSALEPDAAQLQALIDFAKEHFAFEESLMSSADYPKAEWHAKYHASLLEEFRTFWREVPSGQNINTVDLMCFLWGWLNVHIDSADRELVVWLRSHEPDGNGRRNSC